jgi:hypothetical protein
MEPVGDLNSDRFGEARRLLEASVDVSPPPPRLQVGKGDDRLGAAAILAVGRL